ncbi:TssQ family T6SS-associated lipoprotein [Ferrigenium sp. UT5]|uniref:TssQ family T6SS-associated lipoprotein n=1 Tax=Ferrigenium sp. UT5 TaxID=3242105 RepID=UPI00354B24C3
MLRWIMAGLIPLLLAGCGSIIGTCDDGRGGIRLFGKSEAEYKLNRGLKDYEDGNYINSMNALQDVLETKLANKEDKVIAYKYLAFIHCISSREMLCKEYFRKVLLIDPTFELSPAEVGHPLWGPAFRSVKGSKTNK